MTLRIVGLLSGLLLGSALLLLVVQNTDPVLGRFLWFSADMPAVVLLFFTATGGFVLGLAVAQYINSNKELKHGRERKRDE